MRITLAMDGAGIGYLDYEIINWYDKLGQLGAIITKPVRLSLIIERRIKTNYYNVVVSGGDLPPNLSSYWDGVVATLNNIKQEVKGFDYYVPAGEDPLEDTSPLPASKRGRVY